MIDVPSALLLSAALTWLMIMLPALVKMRLWTPAGFKLAAGNRDNVPEAKAWVARAERASKNMLENMVLFVAVCAGVYFAGRAGKEAEFGATLFFYARVAYWLVYLAGIPYLRTALWLTGVVGMVIIGLDAV